MAGSHVALLLWAHVDAGAHDTAPLSCIVSTSGKGNCQDESTPPFTHLQRGRHLEKAEVSTDPSGRDYNSNGGKDKPAEIINYPAFSC